MQDRQTVTFYYCFKNKFIVVLVICPNINITLEYTYWKLIYL